MPLSIKGKTLKKKTNTSFAKSLSSTVSILDPIYHWISMIQLKYIFILFNKILTRKVSRVLNKFNPTVYQRDSPKILCCLVKAMKTTDYLILQYAEQSKTLHKLKRWHRLSIHDQQQSRTENVCLAVHVLQIMFKPWSHFTSGCFAQDTFSSPEAAILLVSDRDRDLWLGPTPEVRDSRTYRHSAHAQSQVWQIWLVLVSIYCVYKAIQNRNVVGPGQRSRSPSLTKRIAASGDENGALWKMSASKPYAHAQYGKPVLVVVLVLQSKGSYCHHHDRPQYAGYY